MKEKKLFLLCFIFLALFCTLSTQNTVYASNKAKLSNTKITISKGSTKTLKIKNSKKKVKWKIISGSKIVSLKKKKSNSITIKAKKKGTAKVQAIVGKKHLICKIVVKNSSTKLCKTQYGIVNRVSCPQFHFKYPSNWKITRYISNQGEIGERIVLKNARGVTVIYMQYNSIYALGNSGRYMDQIKATKIADANFVPAQLPGASVDYSKLGRFIIAELKTVGTLYMDRDSDFKKIDGGVAYAVVPKSYVGLHEVVGDGFYSEFSFKYAGTYSFTAQAPQGKFTKKEKSQVINILKSFNE